MAAAPPPPPPYTPTGPSTVDAQRLVSGPAIGLLVTAGLGFLAQIIGLLMNLLGMGMAGMSATDYQGMEGAEWMAPLMSGTIGIISAVIGIGIAVLIFFGALKMKQLKSYGLSMTAAIVAMVPCISPCCLVGLPIGIWALVVLLKPEVKAAFS
jgi:hypothetical protein